MNAHISRVWICPQCDFAGENSEQCAKCANRCGLLNLSSVLNRKPVRAEVNTVLTIMEEIGKELIA